LLACGTAALAQPPAYVPSPPVPPAAPAAYALDAERAAFLTAEMQQAFLRLGTSFKVIGPASRDYNAYSYARGFNDRWLLPEAGTAQNPLAGVDRLLAEGGYQRLLAFDLSVQPGRQKVVVYAVLNRDGTIKEPTAV